MLSENKTIFFKFDRNKIMEIKLFQKYTIFFVTPKFYYTYSEFNAKKHFNNFPLIFRIFFFFYFLTYTRTFHTKHIHKIIFMISNFPLYTRKCRNKYDLYFQRYTHIHKSDDKQKFSIIFS